MGKFQNNPSIGWLPPKSTHAHLLTWAKQFTPKPITLSIQPNFDSQDPYTRSEGVPTMPV
jgi:hypothetical protein